MVAAVNPLTELAYQARSGDERALGEFVESCYDQVWRLCSSLVGDQDADDVSQETFSRVVRALPKFRGESSARTWVLAIARHACLDEIRARCRRRHREPAHTGRQGQVVADASQDATVADLIGRLDPDRRAAFVLTQVLGLSYDETATVCECPIGTVRSRLARARADLVDLLGRSEELTGTAPSRSSTR